MAREQAVSFGARDGKLVSEFIQSWCISHVLLPYVSALAITSIYESTYKPSEDGMVFVLPFEHTESIADTCNILCILVIIH